MSAGDGHFESCQKYVNEAEGGANFTVVDGRPVLKSYATADRGGPTKYGITAATLSAACADGLVTHNDIVRLTRDEALTIYRARYWVPSRADGMKWGLCLVHYDCAVNCGVSGAGRQLQRALNNLSGKLVFDGVKAELAVDGVVGTKTLEAVGRFNARVYDLVDEYLRVREAYYRGLVKRDARQGRFLKGWLNRLEKIRRGAM